MSFVLPPIGEIAGARPLSIRVQSVLYHAEPHSVMRAAEALGRAADEVRAAGRPLSIELAWGDGSKSPILDERQLAEARARVAGSLTISYAIFGANLGSARGHNRLFEACAADLVLIMNPDVVFAPDTLSELLRPFERPGIGLVEARQLPIEHPKDYDPVTGETGWATTACALIPSSLMREVGGFDADTFFLYCDDVDFSWRLRLAGYKVIFQPSAVVFHDKRLSPRGEWVPSGAERYYSAEAALLLAHKWSRPDITTRLLAEFAASGNPDLVKAGVTVGRRIAEGRMAQPVDPDHVIAAFVDGMYARHRFKL